MEIINIEARTFDTMMERFESFTRSVDKLCERDNRKEIKKWLDNQDVCTILNISKRTLQTLRSNGTLAYTMIGHKTYYKPEDVQEIVNEITIGKEVKNEK